MFEEDVVVVVDGCLLWVLSFGLWKRFCVRFGLPSSWFLAGTKVYGQVSRKHEIYFPTFPQKTTARQNQTNCRRRFLHFFAVCFRSVCGIDYFRISFDIRGTTFWLDQPTLYTSGMFLFPDRSTPKFVDGVVSDKRCTTVYSVSCEKRWLFRFWIGAIFLFYKTSNNKK